MSVLTLSRSAPFRAFSQGLMAVLDDIRLDISVMLGQTTMPVHQLLRMGRGAVIELDASEDDEVIILANSMPVARGAIVVIGNRIAVEVKTVLKRAVDAR
jgi:flagellar motor switch protein FliN/FliY